MFRPLTMRHVHIQVLRHDLPRVALQLAELGIFNPDYRTSDEHPLTHVPGNRYRELYRQASGRLEKITSHFIDLPSFEVCERREVRQRELAAINRRLGALWSECSTCQEALRRLDEEERLIDQLRGALDNFANLRVDLGMLQGEKEFLDVRIGVVPRVNLERMRDSLGLSSFLVYDFLYGEGNAHIVVVGPKGTQVEQVESVLESAGFRDLPIPPELADEPDAVRRHLDERQARVVTEREKIQANLKQRTEQVRPFVERAAECLALARPYVDLDTAARSSTEIAIVSGWVPARDLTRLEQALQQSLDSPFMLQTRAPRPDERPVVPTLLSPNRLLLPFALLVKQYGIPRYGEIDPSAVFAVTFILMFGMMFGDIGHGLLITLAALWWRKTLGRFTSFAVLAGLTSTIFGAVYGSVFGYEEIMHPLWMSPLSNPILLLKIALSLGVGFLLLMNLLSIYNRIIDREWERALLDSNGASSLGLYLGLVWGAYNLFQGSGFGTGPATLTIGSLVVFMVYKWRETHAPLAERAMVVLVEAFESVMGSVSNTLSFLRVAAFSLNHVALAVAVFTLADMMDTTGHWLMVIFGNLFILVLEGAIVAIQALRLEYYEGFSKFYSGDGREFRPLRLSAMAAVRPASNG